MINTFFGYKVKQSQEFTEAGVRMPVTYIHADPCFITKIDKTDLGMNVQVGFGLKKHITKAESGHLKKAGLETKLRFLRQLSVTGVDETFVPGQQIDVSSVFQIGDAVQVTGISKGKGFAGVVKRHHFKGGPRTHGQSDRERSPGSIGQTTTPGRVYRGKRMAGRMGGDQVTVRGLQVISIDPVTNILKIKGVVPGSKQAMVTITKE